MKSKASPSCDFTNNGEDIPERISKTKGKKY